MCRVPSLLLRAGRGQGSQMVSAFQKVSRKSWGGGAVCEQLKEKGVMGTSESGVSGPRAYGQRVEQEAAALIFELGPSPSGPSYRVNQAGLSPWPWSPGSGRGRQTHLLGAPALRFSEDPGLCVHSLAPPKETTSSETTRGPRWAVHRNVQGWGWGAGKVLALRTPDQLSASLCRRQKIKVLFYFVKQSLVSESSVKTS